MSLTERPWGVSELPVGALLAERARRDGDYPYCRQGERVVTVRELDAASNRMASALLAAGLRPGDRVALMLGNSIEHMFLFFALAKIGACQVPINIHLRGEGLDYILGNSECRCLVAEGELHAHLAATLASRPPALVYWRGRPAGAPGRELGSLLAEGDASPIAHRVAPDDLVYICYTSGTTGLPKGVMLTDRMLRVAGWAAGRTCDARQGDVLHMWEPFYHIGGCEVLILAVQHAVTLAMVPRFSVSSFWSEVRRYGATQIHFLGGIMALLLKQPPGPADREHGVRVAWGGGCPEAVWQPFQERFGIPIRECYGMTECASFATLNASGKIGSVGRPLPYFEIRVVDEAGRPLGPGERGEIWIRETVPGVLTKGYWRSPAATAAALADGWLRTGDLGRYDAEGDFTFLGRKKDSLRRRGENISAFEVERIINQHPAVEESAVIGVPSELADEEIKVFLRLKPGQQLAPAELIRWCEPRLAHFQIPRYVAVIDAFPVTPSLRIRKELLPRGVEDSWDREAAERARG